MNGGPKIGHNIGRRKATDRHQPRKSKRDEPVHADRYAHQRTDQMLAALVEHFMSEERANERR